MAPSPVSTNTLGLLHWHPSASKPSPNTSPDALLPIETAIDGLSSPAPVVLWLKESTIVASSALASVLDALPLSSRIFVVLDGWDTPDDATVDSALDTLQALEAHLLQANRPQLAGLVGLSADDAPQWAAVAQLATQLQGTRQFLSLQAIKFGVANGLAPGHVPPSLTDLELDTPLQEPVLLLTAH